MWGFQLFPCKKSPWAEVPSYRISPLSFLHLGFFYCVVECKAEVMQADCHGERKQHNYDEMQQALSVITKQTADVLWDSRARAVAVSRFNQIANLQGPPTAGIILSILFFFEAKIQPRLYHKHCYALSFTILSVPKMDGFVGKALLFSGFIK